MFSILRFTCFAALIQANMESTVV